MPESKSGSNLRALNQRQRDLARAEYLRHPDASISDVVKSTGVGTRTVARAREALVREGLLPAGRNSETGAGLAVITHSVPRPPIGPVRPERTDTAEGQTPAVTDQPANEQAGASEASQPATINGEKFRNKGYDADAVAKMSAMLDELANEPDDVTQARALKMFKRFMFDPTLHADTSMSAAQGWMKLKEMARAKELGPGVPLTLDAAIARCTDFLKACGAKVAVPAFYAAFDLGPIPDAQPAAVESKDSAAQG